MRIMIDARWIVAAASGIGIHTRQLISGLHALGTEHEFSLLFCEEKLSQDVPAECGVDWPTVLVPYGPFAPKGQFALPGLLRRNGIDVFHSTNFMMPLRGKTRTLVTIHDLIPMRFRDHAPRSKKSRLYPVYHQLMLQIGRRADGIIAVSEASRRDIVELLRVKPADKVAVVYNGIDPEFRPGEKVARAVPPEILYVGRLDPYKNVPALVEAFGQARKTLPEGTSLRIIGPPDERYPEARTLSDQLQLPVTWSGGVRFDELVRAYQKASVLVLASDYEGFGLPVVEAMACGTPVICGNRSSLPEVAGDAALQIEPGNVAALSDALQLVLNDAERANGMREAGIAQAAQFTTDRMARETLRVYEQR